MLKKYIMPNGRTYQFEESEAPKCAVEQKKAEPKNKARTTKTKAVKSK